ncbi:MAG: Gfo/Idh/MocA family oxidoreductase [Bryobacteraceae bacterium]|nr:Gfo/Idh/MocA family oxidoreductase [Bryobacteraceae bacterium]
MDLNLNLEHCAPSPIRSDYRIGAIGAGFIMRDVQLPAYRTAGFPVAAIASRTPEIAREVADVRGISKVYDTIDELLADDSIDIFDIAVPPDRQVEIVRQLVRIGARPKGILAQKPLATDLAGAREMVNTCAEHGITLAVNQNMRYDQSIRALRTILQRGYLGEPVLATIEMRAVPHWQSWLQQYQRLTLLNMSVHHLDTLRWLFGQPDAVYTSARRDPRTEFPHEDGICLYILEYNNGFRASGWDDVWLGPRTPNLDQDPYIRWRVEGLEGVAEGWIGWPQYPNRKPSQMRFNTLRQPDMWLTPKWNEVWFPDAFSGPMGSLMDAITLQHEPENSGRDNLATMALVEACYLSLGEKRRVELTEIALELEPKRVGQ